MINPLRRTANDAEFAYLVAQHLISRGLVGEAHELIRTIAVQGVHVVVDPKGWKSVRRGLPTDQLQPTHLV